MSSFEQQYPVEARKFEIGEILKFVTKSASCQLISVPGAGRATVMRLLAFNEEILNFHLGQERDKYIFAYINFAECPSFESLEFYKFIFISFLLALEKHESVYQESYALFTEALSLKDEQVMFQNLKKTVQLCSEQSIAPVFLFDRFSEFVIQSPNRLFADLKSLRASSGKLSIVFSTHYPLEDLLPPERWKEFWEFFIANHVFLKLNDPLTTNFRIALLEKEYGKNLEGIVKEKLIELTGGHGKLMKLSSQLVLSETEAPHPEKLERFLLAHILIQSSLLEIWDSLPKEEHQAIRNSESTENLEKLQLPFPLLSSFVHEKLKEKLIPKEIRYEESDNTIYFGDEPVEGLTAYEFKLLLYLIRNPDRVVERDEIINSVWSDEKSTEGVSDEALSQMVYRLRKKVEDEAESPKHILTVKGRGLRFIP